MVCHNNTEHYLLPVGPPRAFSGVGSFAGNERADTMMTAQRGILCFLSSALVLFLLMLLSNTAAADGNPIRRLP